MSQSLRKNCFFNSRVISDNESFKQKAEIIVTNRLAAETINDAYKVYSHHIFDVD